MTMLWQAILPIERGGSRFLFYGSIDVFGGRVANLRGSGGSEIGALFLLNRSVFSFAFLLKKFTV